MRKKPRVALAEAIAGGMYDSFLDDLEEAIEERRNETAKTHLKANYWMTYETTLRSSPVLEVDIPPSGRIGAVKGAVHNWIKEQGGTHVSVPMEGMPDIELQLTDLQIVTWRSQ